MHLLTAVLFIAAMLMLLQLDAGKKRIGCPGCTRVKGHAPGCHFNRDDPED